MVKSDFGVCISKQGPQFSEWTHSLTAKPLTFRGRETLWLRCALAWATFMSVSTCSAWELNHDSLCTAVPSPSQRAGGNYMGGLRIRKHSVYGKVPSWASFPFTKGGCVGRARVLPLAVTQPWDLSNQERAGASGWGIPSGCRSAGVPRCLPFTFLSGSPAVTCTGLGILMRARGDPGNLDMVSVPRGAER